jgi:hypothetical protein
MNFAGRTPAGPPVLTAQRVLAAAGTADDAVSPTCPDQLMGAGGAPPAGSILDVIGGILTIDRPRAPRRPEQHCLAIWQASHARFDRPSEAYIGFVTRSAIGLGGA